MKTWKSSVSKLLYMSFLIGLGMNVVVGVANATKADSINLASTGVSIQFNEGENIYPKRDDTPMSNKGQVISNSDSNLPQTGEVTKQLSLLLVGLLLLGVVFLWFNNKQREIDGNTR